MDNPRYPYWPLPERPVLKLPDQARVAFWVVPNIEHFRFDKPLSEGAPTPDVPGYAQRDYGLRVGVWRLMEILDRLGIRATVALNAEVCRHEPQIVRAGLELKWEWMGHGLTNSERLSDLSLEDERRVVLEVRDTLTQATGSPPRGWLSPGLQETENTLDLLAEAGFEFVADWWADDQPFPMRVASGRMIGMPYAVEVSDLVAFAIRGMPPEHFYRVLCDQFDALYADGARTARVMGISLHPYLSGIPYRAVWVEKALAYIAGHEGVWLATGGEIASWYYANYYAQAPL